MVWARFRGPGWGKKGKPRKKRVEWHEIKNGVFYLHEQAGRTEGGRGGDLPANNGRAHAGPIQQTWGSDSIGRPFARRTGTSPAGPWFLGDGISMDFGISKDKPLASRPGEASRFLAWQPAPVGAWGALGNRMNESKGTALGFKGEWTGSAKDRTRRCWKEISTPQSLLAVNAAKIVRKGKRTTLPGSPNA